jgi:hypothetical protein
MRMPPRDRRPPRRAALSTRYLPQRILLGLLRAAHRCSTVCPLPPSPIPYRTLITVRRHDKRTIGLSTYANAPRCRRGALAVSPEALCCLARVLWLRRDRGEGSVWVRSDHMRRAPAADDLRAYRRGRLMPCNHIYYSLRLFCRRSCIRFHQTNLPSLLPAQTRKRAMPTRSCVASASASPRSTTLRRSGSTRPAIWATSFLEYAPRLPRIQVREFAWLLLVLDKQRHAVHAQPNAYRRRCLPGGRAVQPFVRPEPRVVFPDLGATPHLYQPRVVALPYIAPGEKVSTRRTSLCRYLH